MEDNAAASGSSLGSSKWKWKMGVGNGEWEMEVGNGSGKWGVGNGECDWVQKKNGTNG